MSTCGDALWRLIGGTTHLYENGQRYWFSTQPSVNRLAQDRAEQQREDVIEQELLRRLREELRQRGDFAGVHLAPASSADVSDDREARLVVLEPLTPHAAPSKQARSEAREQAKDILETRGTAHGATRTCSPSSSRTRSGWRSWSRRRGSTWPGSRSRTTLARDVLPAAHAVLPRRGEAEYVEDGH